MPTSQHPIELYTSTQISELLDAELSPEKLLERLNESIPDLILDETQVILQPNSGLRTPRSVIEGCLQELFNHPPIVDSEGKITLICNPGQIEALYIVVSAIIRMYPVLDYEGSKYSALRQVLYRKMQYFQFICDESETPPDLTAEVKIGEEINQES